MASLTGAYGTASTQNCWASFGGSAINVPILKNVEVLTTAQWQAGVTLTPQLSGSLFLVPALSGTSAVLLPPPAASAGVNYSFRVTGTVANALTLTAGGGNIEGVYVLSSGIAIKASATTAVITATAVAGDTADISCDGVRWYITGISSATTAGFS